MKMERVCVANVLTAAARGVAPQARARDISVDVDITADHAVRGNVAALEQLFLNLMLNAVEATPGGWTSGRDGSS